MKKYYKYIIGVVITIISIVIGIINGEKHGYNIIPQSSTEWIYILVGIILFIIGVILAYLGMIDLDKPNTVNVKNCSTCRFGDNPEDICNVGSELNDNSICYQGELWQSKE